MASFKASVFLVSILIGLSGCTTTSSSKISNEVAGAIALCSAGYGQSDAGILSSQFISSGGDIKGELKRVEAGAQNLTNIDMYKQYLTCINNLSINGSQLSGQEEEFTSGTSQAVASTIGVKSNIPNKVEMYGLEFSSKKCKISNRSQLDCKIGIKNTLDEEVVLEIHNAINNKFVTMYGNNGDHISSSKVKFGSKTHSNLARQPIPGDLFIDATFTFEGVSLDVFPASIRVPVFDVISQSDFPVVIKGVELE